MQQKTPFHVVIRIVSYPTGGGIFKKLPSDAGHQQAERSATTNQTRPKPSKPYRTLTNEASAPTG